MHASSHGLADSPGKRPRTFHRDKRRRAVVLSQETHQKGDHAPPDGVKVKGAVEDHPQQSREA
eukprot:11675784-Alexandrium_andersonii.AAC.1